MADLTVKVPGSPGNMKSSDPIEFIKAAMVEVQAIEQRVSDLADAATDAAVSVSDIATAAQTAIEAAQAVTNPLTHQRKTFSAVDGDFVPGATTQLILPSAPATIASLDVHFDAAFKPESAYLVAGNTLTFDAAIPSGVAEITVKWFVASATLVIEPDSIKNDSLSDHIITDNKVDPSSKLQLVIDGAFVKNTDLAASAGVGTGAAMVGYGAGTVKSALDDNAEELSAHAVAIGNKIDADALAAPGGAALVVHGTESVASELSALQLADYAALRAYAGARQSVYVTGRLVTGTPSGIAGMFVRRDDLNPATSVDNGGTRIVGAHVWDRVYDGEINILWFAADPSGATDATAIFASIESSSESGAYLPAGVYTTTLSALTKNYTGPGKIKLASHRAIPGEFVEKLMPRYLDPMHRAGAAKYQNSPRNLVFVGDSITYGFGVGESGSYSCRIAASLNEQGPGVNVSKANGASALLRAVPAGSVSTGAAGPLKQSSILAPGASLAFTVDNPDFCGFWYQKAPGAGTIAVNVNGANTLTQNCAGAAENDAFAQGTFFRVAGNANVTLTCSGAPVEITGVYFSRWLRDGQVSIMTQAMSGYSTADFSGQAQIDAIGKQTTYKGQAFPVYVVALGTNDIYNASKAVSSATYKAHLDTICQGLRAYGIPVLTVPLRAVETTYSPVLEPFDNYRKAVYEIARKYGYSVVDLSRHDLGSTGGYQDDGLHPNDLGHSLLAAIYWEELGLSGINYAMPNATLAVTAPYTAFGAPYSAPSYGGGARGQVTLGGFVAVNGAGKNTLIANLPPEARPASSKLFVVSGLNGAIGTTATVQVYPDGNVMMYDYPLAALTHLSLEGVAFSTLR